MFCFDTTTRSGRFAEHVSAAFYRLLETHEAPPEADVYMRREQSGRGRRIRICIRLWSPEAVSALQALIAEPCGAPAPVRPVGMAG